MKQKVYRASRGARFSHSKAQLYGEALEDLKRSLGRSPTTDEIWKSAKDPRSRLHDAFTWDQGTAAEKCWRHEARNLVNHIEVVIVMSDRQESVKAFYSVETPGVEPMVYEDIETVARSPLLRQQVIAYALREANEWRRKYRQYSRVSAPVRVIAKAIKKVTAKPRRKLVKV